MSDNLTDGATGTIGDTGVTGPTQIDYDLSQATGTTYQMNIPMGINTLQNNITLTNIPQDVFNYDMPTGRMMGVIYYQNTCIGGFDFGIIDGKAYNLKNYGKFTNSEEGVLPIWYRLTGEYDFDLYLNYTNNRLQAAVESTSGNKTLLIRGILTSGSGYIGSNVYSVDYLMENTDQGGINLISKMTASKGAVLTGGDILIGSTGTNTSIKGSIDFETLTDSLNFNNITQSGTTLGTWTSVDSIAKRIGNICHLSINANLSTSAQLDLNTVYSLATIGSSTSTTFNPSNIVTSDCLINNNNVITKGTIIIEANTNIISILFPSQIPENSNINIKLSVTYIK